MPWDPALRTAECHFCHILLAKQDTKTSLRNKGIQFYLSIGNAKVILHKSGMEDIVWPSLENKIIGQKLLIGYLKNKTNFDPQQKTNKQKNKRTKNKAT